MEGGRRSRGGAARAREGNGEEGTISGEQGLLGVGGEEGEDVGKKSGI